VEILSQSPSAVNLNGKSPTKKGSMVSLRSGGLEKKGSLESLKKQGVTTRMKAKSKTKTKSLGDVVDTSVDGEVWT